jgi:amino acid transporter
VGKVVAVLIVLTLFSSGAVWIEGSDRAQAIAALDGAAPAWMGRFASFGTPIAVNITSGVVGSLFVFLGILVTKGRLADFFSVMIALTASTATVAYLFVFPALVVLRKKRPDVHRPYRVPGGMFGAWVCVVLTEIVVVLTGVTLLWPGLIDRLVGQSYDIQANWGVSRAFFESVTLGSFAVIVLIGVVFWWIGTRNRERGIAGESDLVTELAAPAPHQGGTP